MPETTEVERKGESDAGSSPQMSLRRSLVMITASSALTPIVGLATAPILAQSLGVDGRGAMAAALAPALIVGSVATFGVSESLTYHIAKRPALTAAALWRALLFVTCAGIPVVVGFYFLSEVLSGGDAALARVMQIAVLLGFPALHTGLLRGAAAGRQLWGLLTVERVLIAVLRLSLIVALSITSHLTVLTAVLITLLVPVATTALYWRLLVPTRTGPKTSERLLASLLTYGASTWIGSVAMMLLSRINQLLMTPLSSVEQVGLLAVAITIADVPFIFSASVRDVLFGISSSTSDIDQLARVSRLTLLLTVVGSAGIALTLPFWLAPLFGSEFAGALPVTLLLLASQAVAVPGMMMGAAAAALGKPGVRSTAQVIALVANVVGLALLAPLLGAVGAGIASLVDTTAVALFTAYRIRKLTETRIRDFYALSWSDTRFLISQSLSIVRRRRAP